MREIETKIVDIDQKSLRASLKKARAKYLGKTYYKRYVFDMHPTGKTNTYDELVRVRTDGKRTTLTYKLRKGKGLANTEEIEVEVSDFKKAYEMMLMLWKGRKPYYQENIVERWIYKNAEVAICTWPLVKPFLEIEAGSVGLVRKTIKELNISGTELGNTNIVKIFDMNGVHGKDQGDLRL